MENSSIEISKGLFLNYYKTSSLPVPDQSKEQIQVNHVVVVDCSGSMSYDLPRIREQFKKKIPKLLNKEDTLSIVWFSGKGQFGTLLEAEPVASLVDLNNVNKAIDRWLNPVGMTGFKEPFQEVERLVGRISKNNKGIFSLFFMSDGADNQNSKSEIISAVEKISKLFASATFVEYGYYADRQLLTQMSEKVGGSLIFADNFDSFSPSFDKSISKKHTGNNLRLKCNISVDTIGGFVWYPSYEDLVTHSVEIDTVSIPERVPGFYFLSASPAFTVSPSTASVDANFVDAVYAAISLFSIRMQPKVVLPLLKFVGDVKLINNFSGCFGKQKYSEFMEMSKAFSFNRDLRFENGVNRDLVPNANAFTVLDLLQLLSEDDENKMLLDSGCFVYNKIGRSRDTAPVLSNDEERELHTIQSTIGSIKDVKLLKSATDRMSELLLKAAPTGLKFEKDKYNEGYPIINLTFNEDRPNISVLVRKTGTINLGNIIPNNLKGKIPEHFSTFIFRNYTIVKDGLINVDVLPVRLSESTLQMIKNMVSNGTVPKDLISETIDQSFHLIHLSRLPVINQNMIDSLSAKTFFKEKFDLLKNKAAQKVYSHFLSTLDKTPKSKTFAVLYGEDGANWLKENGITDYSGFSPKTVQAEPTDVYLSKELKTSIKGYSTLPSVEKLAEMIKSNKLNGPANLMKPFYDDVMNFLSSDVYTKASNKDTLLHAYVDGQLNAVAKKVRSGIYKVARMTFSLIVGQVWFSEFSSLDENSMDINIDGLNINFKSELIEAEVKI